VLVDVNVTDRKGRRVTNFSQADSGMRRITVLLLLMLTTALPLAQRQDSPQSPLVAAPATAVLVDVVVRDGHGGVITDLEAKDVEVREDGVRQTVVLFEAPRERLTPASNPDLVIPTSRAGASTPTDAPALVALVFEELGEQARADAYKAARVYLKDQKGPGEFVGVFMIDRALHTMVPYTRDIGAVERGVRTATMRPGCPLSFAGDVAPAENDGHTCADGLPTRQRAIATFDALRGLTDALQLVPGRKSVLLFSEGVALESESDVMERFNTVIGRANRSGVSFYTVDAAGLRARNPSAGPRKAMREYTAETPGATLSPDAVMFSEPYVALSRLANETGGAFLDNTNELKRAGRRMAEDHRSYYVLGYIPTNAALDGHYRRIEVRVNRPDVKVQARNGYLALPQGRTLAPHEVAPLLALEQGTRPMDFQFEASVDTSRRPAHVRARVEHRLLHFAQHAESACRARLTVLARAVDKNERTLWINSDAFELSSPLAQCGAPKSGTTTFEREVTLPPNATRVDVIAYDAVAERASVREFQVLGTKR
jgi:VWFA-related protein